MTVALVNSLNSLRRHYLTRLLILSAMVGIAAALGALVFTYVIDFATRMFMTNLVGYRMPLPGAEGATIMPAEATRRWLLFVVPAIGGLLSGLTVYLLAPDAAGHGTDAVIDAFHRHGGGMRKRIPVVKTVATAFTLGTGGSAGREGPIMQVGAGFGSALGNDLQVERPRAPVADAGGRWSGPRSNFSFTAGRRPVCDGGAVSGRGL